MGGKRTRAWKYIFICITCLIFLGCDVSKGVRVTTDVTDNLFYSPEIIHEGDFNGAVEENMRMINSSVEGRPVDKALYNLGLIYAHYDNPARDYKVSIVFFERLKDAFPQSNFLPEAEFWLSLLEKIENSRKEIKTLKIKMEKLSSTDKRVSNNRQLFSNKDFKGTLEENRKIISVFDKTSPGDEALFTTGLIYSHHDNPEKDYEKSVTYFKRLIQDYPQSHFIEQAKMWITVLDIIEKTEEVDIEIEKKKRELAE